MLIKLFICDNILIKVTRVLLTFRKFIIIPLNKMEDNLFRNFKQLYSRLQEASKQAELLSGEVQEIRRQIRILSENDRFKDFWDNFNHISDEYPENRTNKREGNDNTDFPPTKKIKTDFTKDNDYVIIYTDGACEHNGRPNAKAGIGVWFGDNHPLNLSKPVDGRATNNTAEIQACVSALDISRLNGIQKVIIRTDSQFTISCITNWIKKWKRNNWKLVDGGNVKNKEDLIKLDNLCSSFLDIKWEHVPGHRGVKGNEEADKLARLGAVNYKRNKD